MKVSLTRPQLSKKFLGKNRSIHTRKKPTLERLKTILSDSLRKPKVNGVSESEPGTNDTYSEPKKITNEDPPNIQENHTEKAILPSMTILSKAQRKRMKKREVKIVRSQEKAMRPKKVEKEIPLSSNIVLPKPSSTTLDTDEKRLAAVRTRLGDMYANVLTIRPIPRLCPIGLLKDLCPLAVNIRIPDKSGARYAFLQFRNQHDLEMARVTLATKLLNGKPLQVSISSPTLRQTQTNWRTPNARELSDFNWNKLFVAHLPRSTTRLDLGQVFRKASSIRLATFNDGSCRGTCILTYKSSQDALHAFETRHGALIRGVPIYVNFALESKSNLNKDIMPANLSKQDSPHPSEHSDTMDVDAIACAPSTMSCKPSDTGDQQSEFVVNRTPDRKHKIHVTTNHSRVQSSPKLLHEYQLKRKGKPSVSSGPLSALDNLLRPQTVQKPKRAKKNKKMTRKSKFIKHR